MPESLFFIYTHRIFHLPLCFMHWGRTMMMVQRKNATEAAMHHHDLFLLCSSIPAESRFGECFQFFFSQTHQVWNTHLLKRQWRLCGSEWCVYSAHPRRCRCTSQSVSQCLACAAEVIHRPDAALPGPLQPDPPTGLIGVWFWCHTSRWLWAHWMTWRSRWGWSSGWCAGWCREWTVHDLPPVLCSLKDSKSEIISFILQKKSPSLGKTYHHKTKTHTLIFPGGSPHLGPVSWCERADVGVDGEVTQSPQCALHVEETPVVCSFDGWVFQRLLGRLGFGGPGHPGSWVDVVRGASGRLISHHHGHRLDES